MIRSAWLLTLSRLAGQKIGSSYVTCNTVTSRAGGALLRTLANNYWQSEFGDSVNLAIITGNICSPMLLWPL